MNSVPVADHSLSLELGHILEVGDFVHDLTFISYNEINDGVFDPMNPSKNIYN